jgi:hypothetical protein
MCDELAPIWTLKSRRMIVAEVGDSKTALPAADASRTAPSDLARTPSNRPVARHA